MRIASLLLIACLAAGVGCVRRIVAPPETARAQNDLDWRIEREPHAPPPPAEPAPPATVTP